MSGDRAAPAPDDGELVRAAREGDSHAFGQLVRRHLAVAHGVARAVLGNPADADDVCQDAFVAALARLEDCRPEEKFRPWLLAIVRNRAIDLQRRQRVRRAEPLDGEPGARGAGGGGGGLASRDAGPLQMAERADLRAHLEAAIASLTDVRREVLLLHDLEGWTHREIGDHLGLVEGTVRAHLFWARRRVRERLSAELKGETDDDA